MGRHTFQWLNSLRSLSKALLVFTSTSLICLTHALWHLKSLLTSILHFSTLIYPPKKGTQRDVFQEHMGALCHCHNLFSPCVMTSMTLLQSTQTFLAVSEKMWFTEKMWQYSHQLPWQRLHQVKMFCPVPKVWIMNDASVWTQTQRSLTLPTFL